MLTMENNSPRVRGNDPEHIDLIDLAMQLWHGVATIIVFILAGILAAVGYLMLAEEQWTSTVSRRTKILALTAASCC
ncbi:TPA: hypothetical protein RU593_004892 [Salmonella enterica]|nr:hypothetical protein [Salmonella enterica]